MLSKILIILFGIVSIVLGVWGLIIWWSYFVKALMAVVPIFLVFLGIILIIFGYSELKDQLSKKE
ncbi:hypothetical protein [Dictyoglomus thermophilum]|uniref:Uncharacterized protein n=2 Tax=Dictyoglomus thermophilum TaxID=14 RepID=B5YAC8_DICT6|nr:hypothetical protein [Dictyoglomus thermophilum]ACI19472.1 hypothetical protein DICTH_1583 [Dictyoglomus thermophilum H-6-12]MCX7720450.1 hypothetical protein [Dictyoglomus thermophilum]TYT24413.1 hypothetical protein FY122_02445 [Dictyoglomus thermophilum]